MRTLLILLRKEFQQIRRNPAILKIIFIMPAVQLLILPLAADFEVKNVDLAIVDNDRGSYARRLTDKFEASEYFHIAGYTGSYTEALKLVELDKADIIVTIPPDFEKQLIREDEAALHLAVNAVNGAKGNIGSSYAMAIINDYNREIREELLALPKYNPVPVVEVVTIHSFNDSMSYAYYMVPGILVILVTMIGSFLTALNIVHEKEVGTIEQLNVSPIKKYQFILGKLIPFWVMGLVVLSIGLVIARFVYGIIPEGSLGVIFLFTSVYLLALLGTGLLISTISDTQQQAMLISFFFLLVFILMGGLYTAIEGMPQWAQTVTLFNPVRYFIEVMRMVVMKGSSLRDILPHMYVMGVMAVVFNVLAVLTYRKRS